MARFKKYLQRPNESNYLGRQTIGSNYGRGGADLISSVGGFTTSVSSSGTDYIYTWTAPAATSVGVMTFRVGTASTWGHSISGNYYPKYFSAPRATDGIHSSQGRNYSSFRVLVCGCGNAGAPGGGGSGTAGGPGGSGGTAFDTTFTGVSTSYTIKFGISPEPSSRVYFQNTSVGVNTFGTAGAANNGGGGFVPGSPDIAAQPGTGGIVSDISGSLTGYGGGGGGGGGFSGYCGAPGVNGGGRGGGNPPAGCPGPATGFPGTNGGGGGGGAIYAPSGSPGGPFVVILRSSPNSTGKFDS